MEAFYAPSFDASHWAGHTLWRDQAELEKLQELVMAVEEQGPSPKALSGFMVWSARRWFWLKARTRSIKMIGLQQFEPRMGPAEVTSPSWHRLLKKQRWIQKDLWQMVRRSAHGDNQKNRGPDATSCLSWGCSPALAKNYILSFSCESQGAGLWMDFCSD